MIYGLCQQAPEHLYSLALSQFATVKPITLRPCKLSPTGEVMLRARRLHVARATASTGSESGHRSASFQAKACGSLSFSLFVRHAGILTNATLSEEMHFVSAAKIVLDELADMLAWNQHFSS